MYPSISYLVNQYFTRESKLDYCIKSNNIDYIAENISVPQKQSTLENVVTKNNYSPQKYKSNSLLYELFNTKKNYEFIPDNFLLPNKDFIFVGEEEIKECVERTFELMFHQSFPKDIKMSILDEKEFRKIAPSLATIGLSINRCKYNLISEIFVLKDTLGRVMLTIGHELGHVLTPTLETAQDEEAKAYAFSLAWMRIIKENNIGNLRETIILENPAKNGIHNVAFTFVDKMLRRDFSPWQLYQEIISGKTAILIAG